MPHCTREGHQNDLVSFLGSQNNSGDNINTAYQERLMPNGVT